MAHALAGANLHLRGYGGDPSQKISQGVTPERWYFQGIDSAGRRVCVRKFITAAWHGGAPGICSLPGLAENLLAGFTLERFRPTAPRVHRRSINFSRLVPVRGNRRCPLSLITRVSPPAAPLLMSNYSPAPTRLYIIAWRIDHRWEREIAAKARYCPPSKKSNPVCRGTPPVFIEPRAETDELTCREYLPSSPGNSRGFANYPGLSGWKYRPRH